MGLNEAESQCWGTASINFKDQVVQRRKVDHHRTPLSSRSDIEVIALPPEAVVDVPVDVRQDRPALEQSGQ